jgi:hypothetical protein
MLASMSQRTLPQDLCAALRFAASAFPATAGPVLLAISKLIEPGDISSWADIEALVKAKIGADAVAGQKHTYRRVASGVASCTAVSVEGHRRVWTLGEPGELSRGVFLVGHVAAGSCRGRCLRS